MEEQFKSDPVQGSLGRQTLTLRTPSAANTRIRYHFAVVSWTAVRFRVPAAQIMHAFFLATTGQAPVSAQCKHPYPAPFMR